VPATYPSYNPLFPLVHSALCVNTPFLGLHPVFNADLLQSYFPPLLDTSKIAEQLTPAELNLDYMEQKSNDYIVDTQVKVTRQQKLQLYHVVKARQLLHQGKWLPEAKFKKTFLI
jgi:hypothetical protein